MRKILSVFLAVALAIGMCGCGKSDLGAKQTLEDNGSEQEFLVDENIEHLEAEGYSNVADIAYAKIEDFDGEPLVYLNYYRNAPELAIYTIGQFSQNLDISFDFIITWSGEEFDLREMQNLGDEENIDEFLNVFPEDWKETLLKALESSGGIYDFVSVSEAESIDFYVDEIVKEYQESVEEPQSKSDKTEEESKEGSDEEQELIDKFEYVYDEENKFSAGIFKGEETGNISVHAFCHYSEENIGLMQNDFIYAWAGTYESSADISFTATVGEKSYIYMMGNGKILMNTIPTEDIKSIPDSYAEQAKECMNGINDLYVRNGIMEKAYSTLVYEDENVRITFTGVDDKGVNFSVENLTDHTVMIQARTISINGISTNSIIMSDRVAAQSTGAVTARCGDFSHIKEFETITGELVIIGDDWDSYNANFVNVEIE